MPARTPESPITAESSTAERTLALQRAIEAVVWGTPIVSFAAMRRAYLHDAGATYNDIVFWSEPADWRLQLTTPNASAHYVYVNVNLAAGPVVLEVPPAAGAGLFGSILDAWQVPLVDVGPHGADEGKGGRYMLLPPGFSEDVPPGTIAVRFGTYNGYAAFRTIPEASSPDAVARARSLVHRFAVYPLAAGPHLSPQRFIDMSGKLFDGIVRYDASFFDALARMLAEEPAAPEELAQLRALGVRPGEPVPPDSLARSLLDQAARAVHTTYQRSAETDGVLYWPNRRWRTPNLAGAKTGFTFVVNGKLDTNARGLLYYLACAPPARLGSATFYLTAFLDRDGAPLSGEHTYRLHVPADVPARQFWAATVYARDTAAFLREAPRVEASSYAPDLVRNRDGSTDVFFGPTAPAGREANWVYTEPGRPWFTIFRFYRPTESLFGKRWQLMDLERVTLPALGRGTHGDADEHHGWLGTETFTTRYGALSFEGGYPTAQTTERLYEQRMLQRATEVYLDQLSTVSMEFVRRGLARAGADQVNTIVVFDQLLGPQTLLLTGNTETVYALAWLDLHRDGPVVVEAPATVLGGAVDHCQRNLTDIGPPGPDRGRGGKFLFVPPGWRDTAPPGHFLVSSSTNGIFLGLRAFLVDGKPDQPAALLKTTKIYPLAHAARRTVMRFIDGSRNPLDTIFPDTVTYFDALADVVASEPPAAFHPSDRALLASIGIEHGKPFAPDTHTRTLLAEAARVGAAMARANLYASRDPASRVYPDRRWEWAFLGGSATFDSKGYVDGDQRAAVFYAAIGNSPAMVEKVIGAGSQYIWTPRDARGAYLDGGKRYRLHLPPDIPALKFWSVVAYDALSRSELRTSQRFPSASAYTGVVPNPDASIDIYFGPTPPRGKEPNWIQTVPGRGWFPYLRLYSPTQAFFDQTWRPDDIVEER